MRGPAKIPDVAFAHPGCATKPYRKAELARMLRLCLDHAIDHMGDPIPLPYSVQEDPERLLQENPPKPG